MDVVIEWVAEPRRAVGGVVGHLGVRQIGKFVVRIGPDPDRVPAVVR